MGFNVDFDPNDSSYQGDFNRTVVPPGRYTVAMIECIEKETRKQNGACLHMKFSILDGDYEGAHLMAFPIIEHRDDPRSVIQGRKQIAQIARACKKPRLKNTDELFGIPIVVDVHVDGDYNRIDAYYTEEEGGAAPVTKAAGVKTNSSGEVPF